MCQSAQNDDERTRRYISRSSFVDTDSMRLSEALWGGRSIGGGGSVGGSRGRHGRYFLKNDSERSSKSFQNREKRGSLWNRAYVTSHVRIKYGSPYFGV